MNAPDRVEQFISVAQQLGQNRRYAQDWALYERLKRELNQHYPNLSPAEYERAISALTKAAGI